MDITSFIPSQRQAILERFQQVEALGLGAVRIELKVANPVGIIYECYIMAGENYFSDQAVVSFRILYEKDSGTHFFGCGRYPWSLKFV